MKKKGLIGIVILIFCFWLCGCEEKEVPLKNKIFIISWNSLDKKTIECYTSTSSMGIYVLKESQTYNLKISFYKTEIYPDLVAMKYDDAIFDVVLLNPEADGTVDLEYQVTCLKKCDMTTFFIYRADYSDISVEPINTFVLRVE